MVSRVLVKRGVDRMGAGVTHGENRAVGRRARNEFRADHAVGARSIVHDHVLAQRFAQFGREHAAYKVVGSGGRIGNDDTHGFVRQCRALAIRCGGAQRDSNQHGSNRQGLRSVNILYSSSKLTSIAELSTISRFPATLNHSPNSNETRHRSYWPRHHGGAMAEACSPAVSRLPATTAGACA